MVRRSGPAAIAAVASFILVVVGVAVIPAAALASSSVTGDAAPVKRTRPDAVSAMVSARASGERVEDLSQRSATALVFANPDGTWTAEVATEPERVQDEAGEWHDIDTTLVERDGALEPAYAASDLRLSDGGDKTFAAVSEDGKDLAWKWPTSLPAPKVEGDTATYVGAVDGGDLVVRATPTGFTHSVVLRERPTDPDSFAMPVVTDGAKLTETAAGGLQVKAADGEVVASAPRPLMWDASKDENGDSANVVPVDATVTQPGGTIPEGAKAGTSPVLTLSPDQGFLADPATKYPVTIDPAFTVYPTGEVWLYNKDYTSGQTTYDEMRVGTWDGGTHMARSFMHFDSTLFSNKDVTNATLRLNQFAAGGCTASQIQVAKIIASWSASTITWSNQPATDSTNMGYSSVRKGRAGCPAGDVDFEVTEYVQAWAKGGINEGLRLRAAGEASDNNSWSKYRGTRYAANTGLRPRLIVTYNQAPYVPPTPTITGAMLTGGTLYVSASKPTFTSTVSDPDKGLVRGYYTVATTAGGASVSSCYSASPGVASGSKASCAVGTALADGTYYARASALDGRLYSGASVTNTTPHYSADVKFVVDKTAPTLTLSSTAFTNGGWLTTPPASNTFTLNGGSDVTSFAVVKDGVPSTLTANTSGDATVTWTPTSGLHTLEATAIDRAGNRTKQTFTFGVGSAGIATPVDNVRSTSTFPLSMSGPAGASGATLQWRLADDTTWTNATGVKNGSSVWTGNVTATSGQSTTPDGLRWNATDETTPDGSLAAPALVEIRGCFHFASTSDSCSPVRTVQLVPSAFGGNFPVTDLGPASVALFSGEASISGADAADSRAGIGRTFSSYDDATTTGGVFGPGWSDPQVLAADPSAKATVVDNRVKDGSFVIIDPDSGAQAFIASSTPDKYVPLEPTGDATALTLTAGPPSTLVLSRPLGSGAVTTSWTLKTPDGGGDPEWVTDTVAAGTPTSVGVESTPGRPTFIRESDASAAATCNPTRQAEACRALTIAYTGTGTPTRVATVKRLIGAAIQGDVKEKVLATYSYDASNRLASVCGPAPAPQPALCTTYDYTTIGGRTLLSQMKPAGLNAWRFDYDTTGRITTIKRERPEGGDATWSVDYSLTPSSAGLPDLSATTATQWGQTVVPTKVIAVYQPYLGAADVSKALLFFTTEDGTVTNTASYGPTDWLVDTNWYDAQGNVVQNLDPTGWTRVQAAPVAERPQVAADASSYTAFNTWGDEKTAGTRVVDEYGPAHTATLENGTTGFFRTHTHTTYDDEPNVDPALLVGRGSTAVGLVVEEISSASDAARVIDYDAKVTKYGYAPVVTGDGNGWVLGSPTTVSTQVAANTWSTQTTRYDASGRQIESRQPGGAADASGAGTDAHSTVTTYYNGAPGSGDCDNKPAWAGLVCKVGPPAGQAAPTNYTNAYDDDLNATSVQESSGGTLARTTTTTYDALGRVGSVTKATVGSGVSNETIATSYGFDPATGLPTTTSSAGQVITTAYDAWGRPSDYTDVTGTHSVTTYDAAGNTATFNDGAGTYAYTYGSHGQLASVDAGGGIGTFVYAYSASGNIDSITYPNGLVANRDYNEIGDSTGLDYTQSGDKLLGFTATVATDGRTIAQTSPASAQNFAYDGLRRLTKTADTRDGACATRTYGFDASSNRTSFAAYAPDANGACQTSTATISKTSTYDSAGRITNTGYTYDRLGRTLTTPQSDAGPSAAGALTATYHADDMVASLGQEVANGSGGADSRIKTYAIDPIERVNAITSKKAGVETERLRYRFSEDSDSPSAIDTSTDGGATWTTTRYVSLPSIGLIATSLDDQTAWLVTNLHGDVVSSMTGFVSSSLDFYTETDEFGSVVSSGAGRYGWLGAAQRSTDTLGGTTLMGGRLYSASIGAFLSVDPVLGGNATAYAYPQDPINKVDLDGRWGIPIPWKVTAAIIWGVKWAIDKASMLCSRIPNPTTQVVCAMGAGALTGALGYVLDHHKHFKAKDCAMAAVAGAGYGLWDLYGRKLGRWLYNSSLGRKMVHLMDKNKWTRKALSALEGWMTDEGYL